MKVDKWKVDFFNYQQTKLKSIYMDFFFLFPQLAAVKTTF